MKEEEIFCQKKYYFAFFLRVSIILSCFYCLDIWISVYGQGKHVLIPFFHWFISFFYFLQDVNIFEILFIFQENNLPSSFQHSSTSLIADIFSRLSGLHSAFIFVSKSEFDVLQQFRRSSTSRFMGIVIIWELLYSYSLHGYESTPFAMNICWISSIFYRFFGFILMQRNCRLWIKMNPENG